MKVNMHAQLLTKKKQQLRVMTRYLSHCYPL